MLRFYFFKIEFWFILEYYLLGGSMPNPAIAFVIWSSGAMIIWLPVRIFLWVLGINDQAVLFWWGVFSVSWPLLLWGAIFFFMTMVSCKRTV
jgi:hypothetical protein